MQIELELLAPAKNRDIGIAAIDCGADAVYIAGPQFGAREGAGNPISEIAELVSYARKFGVKVYMTVNTILYDHELEEAARIIREAYEAGCSAIIVQDLGVLQLDLPPIPLYASTQTNLRSVEQAKFLESLGFERLILARELSLKEISSIKEATNTDIESFVHGALCVSYSGQCYLSHKLTERSANRGACAQACRSLYTLTDSQGRVILKDSPILSLKDFNLSNRIPELVEAGVTSFKIEGRLKNLSYIKNVVRLYRQKIDEFLSNNPQYVRASYGCVSGGFTPDPNLTFNRGYTEFFIDSKRGKWRSTDGAKYLGEYIGTVTKSLKERNGRLKFEYKLDKRAYGPITNGDGLCFVSPKGEISGARANSCINNIVTTTEEMQVVQSSKLFRNYNILFERELEKNPPKRLIPVSLKIESCADETILIANWSRGLDEGDDSIRVSLGTLEAASNAQLAEKSLYTQLGKSAGIFKFTLESIESDVVIPFLPVGKINEIRRDLAERIAQQMSINLMKRRSEQQKRTLNRYRPLSKSAGLSTPLGKSVDYRGNCSNKLSGRIYEMRGAEKIAPAFEIEQQSNAELMRSKYCIKYELGLCPNYKVTAAASADYVNRLDKIDFTEPLFLINGKRRLQLKFDCNKCEMVVIG